MGLIWSFLVNSINSSTIAVTHLHSTTTITLLLIHHYTPVLILLSIITPTPMLLQLH
jgi:hypothetical protein